MMLARLRTPPDSWLKSTTARHRFECLHGPVPIGRKPKRKHMARGRRSPCGRSSAIEADDIRLIRAWCTDGLRQCDIATAFGLSDSAISKVKNRTMAVHVEDL